ncbi:MAG: T9SS type A sorting domain-containing protein, partial [Vicingaceae bacterium]
YINNAGGIYLTTNGGSSWTVQQLNPLTIVHQISFANDSVGFALGDYGIYKTTNGGGSTVGIKEELLKEKIQVFPNPATNYLNLRKLNNVFVENVVLFDMSGKQVGQFNPRNIKFDISNFPGGHYYLKIKTKEGVQVNKIVVLPK